MEEKKFTTKEQRDLRKQGNKGCQSCGEVKSLDNFYLVKSSNRYKPICVDCKRTREIPPLFSLKQQRELKKEGKKGCQSCGEVKTFIEMVNRGESYSYHCKKCKNKQVHDWVIINPDKRKSIIDRFNENNPNYNNEYYKNRYNNDSEFRWSENVRFHMRGVSIRQEFKDLWDDVREVYDFYDIPYHIDHMVPKSWFLVRTPKYLINHLDNLQVIDEDYNKSKLNKWSDPVSSEYLDKIRPYIKKKFEGLLKSL